MANVSSSNGLEKYPKLRFKGFSEPWHEIAIGDLFKVTRGYVLPSTAVKEEPQDGFIFPVFSSQTKNEGLMGYYNEYLYEDAITWTTDGANAGTVHFRDGKFYCTNVCGVLLNEDGNANRCVAEILGSVSKKYVSYVGNPKLMNNVMSEIRIHIPSLHEQKKIDSFIASLDHRITKQRELIEHLKKYKRGVSEQLFEQIKSKSTQHVFSSIFVLLQNNTFSRELLTNEETEMQNIHYGDVLIKYGSCVDIDKEDVPYIKSDAPVDKFAPESYLMSGDIVIADTAEDYTVGKATEIINPNNKKILSGLHTIPCRPVMSFAPMFMGYYLNSSSFRSQIMPLIQGTKVSSIGKTQLMKTTVYIPPVDEQKRIADFLYSIDTKINLLSETADKMIQLKSAMLQQLFI